MAKNKKQDVVAVVEPTVVATEATTPEVSGVVAVVDKKADKKRDKRPPIRRATHPSLKPDAAGKPTVKLTEFPADWSYVYHKALRAEDFVDEIVYYNAMAKYHDDKAAEYRAQATETAKIGNAEDRVKAKKLVKLATNAEKMMAELAAQGIDVTAIMSSLLGKLQPKADSSEDSDESAS